MSISRFSSILPFYCDVCVFFLHGVYESSLISQMFLSLAISTKYFSMCISFGRHPSLSRYVYSMASACGCLFTPLTPMSDQDRISPYNLNTISLKKVMRIKKNINWVIIQITIIKIVQTVRRIINEILGMKGELRRSFNISGSKYYRGQLENQEEKLQPSRHKFKLDLVNLDY